VGNGLSSGFEGEALGKWLIYIGRGGVVGASYPLSHIVGGREEGVWVRFVMRLYEKFFFVQKNW